MRVSSPNGTILCSKCKSELPFDAFVIRSDTKRPSSWCRSCRSEASIEWARKNPKKRQTIKRKHLYGITEEEFLALLVLQDCKCSICDTDFVDETGPRSLRPSVDHNHETLRVRGLLCWHCNKQLEFVQNFGQQAMNYLKEPPMEKLSASL